MIQADRLIVSNTRLNDAFVDITVGEGIIRKIEPHSPTPPHNSAGVQVVNGGGRTAFPGLANMHSHAPMTLFRGLGDDQPLDVWLHDYIWPAEQGLTDSLVYDATLRACHEMLASGTTFFNDMYFRLPAMARAVQESGIRARLGLTVFGDAEELLDPDTLDLLTQRTPNLEFSIAPHSVYTVSPTGLRRCATTASQLGLKLHIHMSETRKEVDDCMAAHGCRPWELLDSLGVLDLMGADIIAAHCLHLSDHEIELIGRHHITCVHCPASNLKLGSGVRFPMQELLDAGAAVRIGTDGSASSNNLDMLEASKLAALLQKGWREDPTAAPAAQIFDMATAARRIAPGEPADFFLIDLNSASPAPHPALSDLLYATHGDQVAATFVAGHLVYKR